MRSSQSALPPSRPDRRLDVAMVRTESSPTTQGRRDPRPEQRARTPKACCRRRSSSTTSDGDYANPIVDWPPDKYNWPPDFKAATEKNAGSTRRRRTGDPRTSRPASSRPTFSAIPFPIIERNDPQAAAKIVWNFFYRVWYFGNLHAESQVNWVAPKRHGAAQRSGCAASRTTTGSPEEERARQPGELRSRSSWPSSISPADLNGTAALVWRYRDPTKRDSNWAYVPALRRVRAVSPANRSDGFLGSDMSQDDGPFFDGKPEDFTWTLKGETRAAALRRSAQPARASRSSAGCRAAAGAPTGPTSHVRRLHGSELEGRRLGAASSRGARQAPLLDRRGRAEGQVLPLRQDPALHRQGDLPGRVEPQVQLAGRAAEHPAGDGV